MTLQLLHSEFPYIREKFDFLFYQCMIPRYLPAYLRLSSLITEMAAQFGHSSSSFSSWGESFSSWGESFSSWGDSFSSWGDSFSSQGESFSSLKREPSESISFSFPFFPSLGLPASWFSFSRISSSSSSLRIYNREYMLKLRAPIFQAN